jgi:hypothetical protein
MAVKLHRCRVMFPKTPRHPCWKVQKALDEAGIEYELVKQPALRWNRTDYEKLTGQRLLPAIESEDGTILREESNALAARITGAACPQEAPRAAVPDHASPASSAGRRECCIRVDASVSRAEPHTPAADDEEARPGHRATLGMLEKQQRGDPAARTSTAIRGDLASLRLRGRACGPLAGSIPAAVLRGVYAPVSSG